MNGWCKFEKLSFGVVDSDYLALVFLKGRQVNI